MMRRILVLNLGLLLVLGFGMSKVRQDWKSFESAHQTSKVQPRSETLPGVPAGMTYVPSSADWTAIPSHNPFSFDRTDITSVAPPDPLPPPKPLGPKPVLFGVMSIGTNRLAMMAPGQGANRNSRPFKIGEATDGWTVVQIDENSVVVDGNGTRTTIVVNDPSAPVQRDHTRTLAGADSTPSIQNVGQTTATTQAARPAPSNSGTGTSAGVPQPLIPADKILPDGSRVIQTPFGPHVIPKDPPEQ